MNLGEIGPEAKAAVPALTELLKDNSTSMQEILAEALGKIGPNAKDVVPAITELLQDKAYAVRASAARALGRMGPAAKDAVPALTQLLQDKEKWQIILPAAATALGDIGPAAKDAVPALTQLLKYQDEQMRKSAVDAWKRFNRAWDRLPADRVDPQGRLPGGAVHREREGGAESCRFVRRPLKSKRGRPQRFEVVSLLFAPRIMILARRDVRRTGCRTEPVDQFPQSTEGAAPCFARHLRSSHDIAEACSCSR